jgi:hypothetical protein
VVRGIVAPPPLPGFVRPWTANWAEHVSPHDPRADVFKSTHRKLIINARAAALATEHLLEGAGPKRPFVQGGAAESKRICSILVRTGAVTVNGERKAADTELGHGFSSS